MIVEISVALIAVMLTIGIVFFVRFLMIAGKTVESAKKDLHHVSLEAIGFIRKMGSLAGDIQSKSESLDVIFRPLKSISKGRNKVQSSGTVVDVMEWLSTSFSLFNKIKKVVKRREK